MRRFSNLRIFGVGLFVFIVLSVLSTPIPAIGDSGTTVINEDEYWVAEIPLPDGGTLKYTITVTSGPNVDVLLFDEENYAKYRAGETSEYYVKGSDLDTSYAKAEVELDPGTYYLVVDNTDYGSAIPPMNLENDAATISYDVEYSEGGGGLLLFGIIILLVIIIATVVIIINRKKKRQL